VATQPSPAPLRLALSGAGPDALAVRLVKRRGPALEQPVLLALPPVLSRAALQRALTPRRTRTHVQALSALA
jgi:protein ImuA